MARRSGLLDDMFDIAASLPWKLSLVIAAVGYFGFHYLADMPVTQPGAVNDLANHTGRQLIRVLSLFLQFIVPGIFLLGAFFAFLRQRRQSKIHADITAGGDRTALESISWSDFEILTAEVFRRKGFTVEHRGGNGADGGIDLVMWRGRDKYLCQCKQWKSAKVGVNVVRELFGVMAAEGAVGGFVVASGEFTKDAQKFAEGRSIELVSTDLMLRLVQQTLDNGEADHAPRGTPSCPSCGSEMVLRSATRGAMAGSQFWGCTRFPACTGTRQAG